MALQTQVPLVSIFTLYLLILLYLKRNSCQRRNLGLTRPDPQGRRDIQCHQNGKLLLSEKRALKLMGELWPVKLPCLICNMLRFIPRLWRNGTLGFPSHQILMLFVDKSSISPVSDIQLFITMHLWGISIDISSVIWRHFSDSLLKSDIECLDNEEICGTRHLIYDGYETGPGQTRSRLWEQGLTHQITQSNGKLALCWKEKGSRPADVQTFPCQCFHVFDGLILMAS